MKLKLNIILFREKDMRSTILDGVGRTKVGEYEFHKALANMDVGNGFKPIVQNKMIESTTILEDTSPEAASDAIYGDPDNYDVLVFLHAAYTKSASLVNITSPLNTRFIDAEISRLSAKMKKIMPYINFTEDMERKLTYEKVYNENEDRRNLKYINTSYIGDVIYKFKERLNE